VKRYVWFYIGGLFFSFFAVLLGAAVALDKATYAFGVYMMWIAPFIALVYFGLGQAASERRHSAPPKHEYESTVRAVRRVRKVTKKRRVKR